MEVKVRYQPGKGNGYPSRRAGIRTLGVPTVVDRLFQQALHQVMQPRFEPTFSDGSYGFRPGRSATQAVVQAATYTRGTGAD